MTRVIEDCITLQSVNKVVKTRHDVIKYLSWRELDWEKRHAISSQKKLDPVYLERKDHGKVERKVSLISGS